MKNDPSTAESICLSLLNQPGTEVEQSIRIGDCYALLIEQYHSMQQWRDAYDTMKQMESRGIVLAPYLENGIMEDICRGAGEDMPGGVGGREGGGGGGGSGSEDEIDDEIGELDESINESLGSEDEDDYGHK